MNLSIVVPVLGQHDLVNVALRLLRDNKVRANTRLVVIDNGGDYTPADDLQGQVDVFRALKDVTTGEFKNIGVYEAFRFGMRITGAASTLGELVSANSSAPFEPADIVAFFHSDLMVAEKGYDQRIVDRFEANGKLGMVGFVGSDEIDFNGGRGLGTMSNFLGNGYNCIQGIAPKGEAGVVEWVGSPAEVHGRRETGFARAAVVDGCAMVLRRQAWVTIEFKEDWPPHHFYDRLISTQLLEAGWQIEVLGIGCDHISGQTVAKEERYNDLAKEWCIKNNIAPTHNWDDAIYREAEKRWLYEYRQVKGIVPVKV